MQQFFLLSECLDLCMQILYVSMVRRLYSLTAKLSEKQGIFFALKRKNRSETGAPQVLRSYSQRNYKLKIGDLFFAMKRKKIEAKPAHPFRTHHDDKCEMFSVHLAMQSILFTILYSIWEVIRYSQNILKFAQLMLSGHFSLSLYYAGRGRQGNIYVYTALPTEQSTHTLNFLLSPS